MRSLWSRLESGCKIYSLNPASWFGLELADTVVERVPLILGKHQESYIKRIKPKKQTKK